MSGGLICALIWFGCGIIGLILWDQTNKNCPKLKCDPDTPITDLIFMCYIFFAGPFSLVIAIEQWELSKSSKKMWEEYYKKYPIDKK